MGSNPLLTYMLIILLAFWLAVGVHAAVQMSEQPKIKAAPAILRLIVYGLTILIAAPVFFADWVSEKR